MIIKGAIIMKKIKIADAFEAMWTLIKYRFVD